VRPAAALPSLAIKEARALLWPWLACMGAVLVPTMLEDMGSWPLVYHIVGAPALGALVMGQEFSGGTLALLLSQPVSRGRLYSAKMLVLALMLASLVAASHWAIPAWRQDQNQMGHAWVLLPALCGLCVTPWLTMATRNPLAGTVFTFAIPGMLLAASSVFWSVSGRTGNFADFQLANLWRVVLALSAAGAVAGWRAFMRLEVTGDSDAAAVTLPAGRWFRGAPAVTPRDAGRRPMQRLLAKELRLQQLSLALAGLFLVGRSAGWFAAEGARQAISVVTVLYMLLVAVVIGAFASAEERQLGTIQCQALVPISAATQWAVKMAVVFGLVVLLALGLPGALETLAAVLDPGAASQPSLATSLSLARYLLLVAAGSVYVSSLSGSAARALAIAIPALAATASEALFVIVQVDRFLLGHGHRPLAMSDWWWYHVLDVTLGAAFLVLVARLARTNHFAADRPIGRVVTQLALIAAAGACWIFALGGAELLFGAGR
jgi:hypothetical protein